MLHWYIDLLILQPRKRTQNTFKRVVKHIKYNEGGHFIHPCHITMILLYRHGSVELTFTCDIECFWREVLRLWNVWNINLYLIVLCHQLLKQYEKCTIYDPQTSTRDHWWLYFNGSLLARQAISAQNISVLSMGLVNKCVLIHCINITNKTWTIFSTRQHVSLDTQEQLKGVINIS